MCVPGAYGGLKRVADSPELQLQVVERRTVGAGNQIKPGVSGGTNH